MSSSSSSSSPSPSGTIVTLHFHRIASTCHFLDALSSLFAPSFFPSSSGSATVLRLGPLSRARLPRFVEWEERERGRGGNKEREQPFLFSIDQKSIRLFRLVARRLLSLFLSLFLSSLVRALEWREVMPLGSSFAVEGKREKQRKRERDRERKKTTMLCFRPRPLRRRPLLPLGNKNSLLLSRRSGLSALRGSREKAN